jgi:alanyl-tRNA synthetase
MRSPNGPPELTEETDKVRNRVTKPLYYEDSRKTDFVAKVLATETAGKLYRIELDQTCFYPEGGGQPADLGTLNGVAVIDVRKDGDRILHYLEKPLKAKEVEGRIDWNRRFHFMQQHTGQHIISGSLKQCEAINTVSVHLGEDATTVEVDSPHVSDQKCAGVEETANGMVCRNLPVVVRWVEDSEVPQLRLRRPTDRRGAIRIVEIPGFDRVACGGIHVAGTGEVMLIKYLGQEKIRGHARLSWKIGRRSMEHYRAAAEISSRLSEELSAQPAEIVDRVLKLKEETKQRAYDLRILEERVACLMAERLLDQATEAGGGRLVARIYEGESAQLLKSVGARLAENADVLFCLISKADDKLFWCIGSGESIPFRFAEAREKLLGIIDGKGGGKPPIYQGIGNNPEGAEEFLRGFVEMAGR